MSRQNSALFRERERARYWRNVALTHRGDAAAAQEAQREMMGMHAEIQQLRQRLGEAEAFIRQNHEDPFQQDQAMDAESEDEHEDGPPSVAVDTMPGGFHFQLGNQSLRQIDDATYDALHEQYGDAMIPTEQTFADLEQFLIDIDRASSSVAPFRTRGTSVMVLGRPVVEHRGGFCQQPHKYSTFIWDDAFNEKSADIHLESHKGDMVAMIRDEDDRKCSICITKYEAGERVVVLPCAAEHRFHHDCVYKWHEEGNLGCPMCREKFNWELAVKKKTVADEDEENGEEGGEDVDEAGEEV